MVLLECNIPVGFLPYWYYLSKSHVLPMIHRVMKWLERCWYSAACILLQSHMIVSVWSENVRGRNSLLHTFLSPIFPLSSSPSMVVFVVRSTKHWFSIDQHDPKHATTHIQTRTQKEKTKRKGICPFSNNSRSKLNSCFGRQDCKGYYTTELPFKRPQHLTDKNFTLDKGQ